MNHNLLACQVEHAAAGAHAESRQCACQQATLSRFSKDTMSVTSCLSAKSGHAYLQGTGRLAAGARALAAGTSREAEHSPAQIQLNQQFAAAAACRAHCSCE